MTNFSKYIPIAYPGNEADWRDEVEYMINEEKSVKDIKKALRNKSLEAYANLNPLHFS